MEHKPAATEGGAPENWAAYTSMAMAFLAVAADARAQIVYTDLDPDVVLSGASYDVDFNNDGSAELTLTQTELGSMHYVGITELAPGASVLGTVTVSYGDMFPNVLAGGAPIAPGDPEWQGDPQGWLVDFYSYGQWSGQSGFLGVRFQVGGSLHYAWVELEMADNNTQVIVKGFAFESTPDSAIHAGATGVPAALQDLHGAPAALVVHPNPVTERLYIKGLDGPASVVVVNMAGEAVAGNPETTLPGTVPVEVGGLPAGAYIAEVRQQGRTWSMRFIKQ
ncbi:MAG: T9SS type A sorting domain-containing protein [Flavobacteriales bacterium]|nr:T9SS type A sorting domain-containing protein [Flavobacteriales bacterium]